MTAAAAPAPAGSRLASHDPIPDRIVPGRPCASPPERRSVESRAPRWAMLPLPSRPNRLRRGPVPTRRRPHERRSAPRRPADGIPRSHRRGRAAGHRPRQRDDAHGQRRAGVHRRPQRPVQRQRRLGPGRARRRRRSDHATARLRLELLRPDDPGGTRPLGDARADHAGRDRSVLLPPPVDRMRSTPP